ncbi:MAG: aminomethyl-transferring glycine dehydrogenase subunit GcvPA [Euryarchaeota archaeon]|nr:aminomethyl-transferring glycine dehydrogenase subunit GcvPA [Euryarchaeota archaeon]MCD6158826.1 aminomethyl-transferring glycine dehydrogenase subunit GcvPA [Euryarchaeota archaeon]
MPVDHLLPSLFSREEMLKELGLSSIEDLFSDIPEKVRKEFNIGNGKSEYEVFRELRALARMNKCALDMPVFLGGGLKIHYVPSAVIEIISRSEFYTSYTPYQPEISQGMLQALFEYQSLMADLTGMEVVNASMYDSATALGEAARMAYSINRRKKIVIPKHINWEKKSVLENYIKGLNMEIVEVPYDPEKGILDEECLKDAVDEDTAAVYVEYPNFFGIINENVRTASDIAKEKKALLIIGVDPIALGVLKPPSDFDADIVVGEGGTLGNPPGFGGPLLGIFATKRKYVMKMPGRLIGMGEDAEGKRAFLMVLQAREQHIRRYKATSNICTNEALCAVASAVYLSLLGKHGLRRLAKLNIYKAKKLIRLIDSLEGFKAPYFQGYHFNEFTVLSEVDPHVIHEGLLSRGVHGGLILAEEFPELYRVTLYATTEVHSDEDYEKLISALREVYESVQAGKI